MKNHSPLLLFLLLILSPCAAAQEEGNQPPKTLTLEIDANGDLSLDSKSVKVAELGNLVQGQSTVTLLADGQTGMRRLLEVVDLLRHLRVGVKVATAQAGAVEILAPNMHTLVIDSDGDLSLNGKSVNVADLGKLAQNQPKITVRASGQALMRRVIQAQNVLIDLGAQEVVLAPLQLQFGKGQKPAPKALTLEIDAEGAVSHNGKLVMVAELGKVLQDQPWITLLVNRQGHIRRVFEVQHALINLGAKGVTIALEQAGQDQKPAPNELTLVIDAEGAVSHNGKLVNVAELSNLAQDLPMVTLRAHRQSLMRRVNEVADILRKIGVKVVVFATYDLPPEKLTPGLGCFVVGEAVGTMASCQWEEAPGCRD